MKNPMATTAVFAALTVGNAANAQGMGGDFYASVFGGLSSSVATADYSASGYDVSVDYESEAGYILGATVGTSINANARAEAEFSFESNTIGTVVLDVDGSTASGDAVDDFVVTTTYLMGNVWFDFGRSAQVVPYAGGGLGVVFVNSAIDGDDFFDPATGIAFQVGAGVQLPVGTGAVDVGYRFKGFTGAEFESTAGTTTFDGSG